MLTKVIFTAAVATSVQAGILNDLSGSNIATEVTHIQHTKPATGSRPIKPTRERVDKVTETIKKIGQIAGSDSVSKKHK